MMVIDALENRWRRSCKRQQVNGTNESPLAHARSRMNRVILWALLWAFIGWVRAETVALWLFDEQVGVYPSSVLNDAGPHSYFLIIGRGAEIGPGKFGRALRVIPPVPLSIRYGGSGADGDSSGGAVTPGLRPPPAKAGRTQPPLMWENAHFAALFTSGDAHPGRAPFANASDSKLNLGPQDWTVECWLNLDETSAEEGVIFEIGSGPRGENELVTRFSVVPRENAFVLTGLAPVSDGTAGGLGRRVEWVNPEGPPGGAALIHSTTLALPGQRLPRTRWFHVALVHVAAAGELRLYVDGKNVAVSAARLLALPHGDEAYVSIGRDGRWQRPLGGAIDELRVSDAVVYAADFTPPGSFSPMHNATRRVAAPVAGPPLLFVRQSLSISGSTTRMSRFRCSSSTIIVTVPATSARQLHERLMKRPRIGP